ncbi:uncharacterized protein LOC116772683 [Danaus plexippus]|uniref:Cuticular protein hypothetical 9 n=1 Tax=Danaus plexippus plexippus TaxID=278856 RepID=A0A212FGD8_DANPL|nr:uncharacterized protein LOC116772683 [Danaus plexippus]OWR52798.1 cuticular protein hypothetical 9 precursor [Danaus plexippus plexippus]
MYKLVVLSALIALAAGSPIAPLWGAPWGAVIAPAPLAAAPLAIAAGIGASNYRGPLSLAPGQPASILAADGRPLDTLDVNVDKAVHYTAKALNGLNGHILKKRSIVAAPLVAGPVAVSSVASLRIPAAGIIAPAPIAVAAPWGWRHW